MSHTAFRATTIAAVLVCYVTILIGGNVMASDSGLACPQWPTCHGALLGPLTGSPGIEWGHRLSALALSLTIVFLLGMAIAAERRRPVLIRFSAAAAALVLAQALLGGVVVESNLAVALVLAHLGLATALFALLLVLAFLANFRDLPPRWLDFARRATEEQSPARAAGAPELRPTPAAPGRPTER